MEAEKEDKIKEQKKNLEKQIGEKREEKMQKRESSRAIIFRDGAMVSMYRERDGRTFYTFPGGGMEEAGWRKAKRSSSAW